jgi:RNA recognition motif-containing protein
MSVKLVVGNLSPDTTSDELCEVLGNGYGVEWCHLITDRDTGRSKCYAFIKLDSTEAANTAKERLNGRILRGRVLRVQDVDLKNGGVNDSRYDGTTVLTREMI